MAKKLIAVFGRADVDERHEDFKDAYQAAAILARSGFSVLSGGYLGVMEAVSKGAFDEKGEAVGVVCSAFAERQENNFLSERIVAADLFERQGKLIEKADGYIAFPPKAGTLSEVVSVWSLRKSGQKVKAPMALVGEKWKKLFDFFKKERIIPENLLQYTFLFSGGGEAARFMVDFFGENNILAGKAFSERS
jgi:uncharacterized protein (TIGR00730 family)